MKDDVFASLQVTKLARCLKMTLRSGQILGFTDHDSDLQIDKITYNSDTGLDNSAITISNSLSVDNVDIGGILSSDYISQEDVLSGKYDFAQVDIFIIDYSNPKGRKTSLFQGWLGEINLKAGKFNVEIRSIKQFLNKTLGELYSPSCRANLGDKRCKVDLSRYSVRAKIKKVINDTTFQISVLGNDIPILQDTDFDFGGIKFQSEHGDDERIEIKNLYNRQLELMLSTRLKIGDDIIMYMGCDKHINTCVNKFNNAINFRGEPYVPGATKLLSGLI